MRSISGKPAATIVGRPIQRAANSILPVIPATVPPTAATVVAEATSKAFPMLSMAVFFDICSPFHAWACISHGKSPGSTPGRDLSRPYTHILLLYLGSEYDPTGK